MRRVPLLVLLLALLAPAPPGHAASCTSGLPVHDGHAASWVCAGVHPGMLLTLNSAKYGTYTCSASIAFVDSGKNQYLSFPGTCVLDFDCLEDLVQPYPPPLDQPPLSDLIPPPPTCTLPTDSELEPYYKKGTGPLVKDGDGHRIGRLAYAVNKDGIDFALVRLDPGVRLDPAVPLYGGPARIGDAPELPGAVAAHEVHGARTATALTLNATSGYVYDGFGATYQSAPLGGYLKGGTVETEDGVAVGMLTGSIYAVSGYEVRPFAPALAHLTARVGLHLRVLSAPLA